eukprot:GHVT01005108.1.p1 GENE.GHVT01005108.1~~GHVT01005108.1.p1  ORF type:complete len:150 (+),score=14.85 GHVT01005108.1:922-1371(+)
MLSEKPLLSPKLSPRSDNEQLCLVVSPSSFVPAPVCEYWTKLNELKSKIEGSHYASYWAVPPADDVPSLLCVKGLNEILVGPLAGPHLFPASSACWRSCSGGIPERSIANIPHILQIVWKCQSGRKPIKRNFHKACIAGCRLQSGSYSF